MMNIGRASTALSFLTRISVHDDKNTIFKPPRSLSVFTGINQRPDLSLVVREVIPRFVTLN